MGSWDASEPTRSRKEAGTRTRRESGRCPPIPVFRVRRAVSGPGHVNLSSRDSVGGPHVGECRSGSSRGLRGRWGKMAAHLSYGRVNLNVLREAVRRELREFLDKCAGSKVRDSAPRHRRPAWPHPVPNCLGSKCTRSPRASREESRRKR